MSNYVYQQSESGVWTVGFFDPNGEWITESDHEEQQGAVHQVAFLNGSGSNRLSETIDNINAILRDRSAEVEKLKIELGDALRAKCEIAINANQLRGKLQAQVKLITELQRREESANINRDQFCGSVNRIAKMIGMNVENAAFEAVERNLASILSNSKQLALDTAKSVDVFHQRIGDVFHGTTERAAARRLFDECFESIIERLQDIKAAADEAKQAPSVSDDLLKSLETNGGVAYTCETCNKVVSGEDFVKEFRQCLNCAPF